MMNRVLLGPVLLLVWAARPSDAAIRRLSEHRDTGSYPRLNDAGQVAWLAGGLVYLWDGHVVRSIGEGARPLDSSIGWTDNPQMSGTGHVAWLVPRGSEWEIDLWDGATVRCITRGWPATSHYRWTLGNGGNVAWIGQEESGHHVFFWDGQTVRRLSSSSQVESFRPQVNEVGHVLWQGVEDKRPYIYLWDGTTVRRFGPGRTILAYPSMNRAGQVVWADFGQIGEEIFLWDGTHVRQLTQNEVSDFIPRINAAGQVVWLHGTSRPGFLNQILFWDGTTITPLTPTPTAGGHAQISDSGHVVWMGEGLHDLWLWDGVTARRLADGLNRTLPLTSWVMSDTGQVVWRTTDTSEGEVYLWNGVEVLRLTNNATLDTHPWVNNVGQVAWAGADGIYLYTPGASGSLRLAPTTVFGGSSGAGIDPEFPATLFGGSPATGTVSLGTPGPPGGATIALASEHPAVEVPASVTVSEGAVAATFPVTTRAVDAATMARVTASYAGEIWPGTLTLLPPDLGGIETPPTGVLGGVRARLRLQVGGQAPPAGMTVTLVSSHPAAARLPESVTIPAGEREYELWAETSPVATPTTVVITATYRDTTRVAELRVGRVSLSDLALSPTPVTGGNTATGVVHILETPPVDGIPVSLASDSPAVASVPPHVVLQAESPGGGSAPFPITTRPVRKPTPVRITASYGQEVRTVSLIVSPVGLRKLEVVPARLRAGKTAQGAVTLSGRAPAGGVVVALQADPPAVVPATVKVPARSTRATFRVAVPKQAPVASMVIRAAYGGTTRTATLQVRAR